MKILESNHKDRLVSIINPYIEALESDYNKNQKKIIELCHLGKFLLFLEPDITIEKLFEEPDFILNYNDKIIGLEHEIIIDDKRKKIEGFYENISQKVETKLRKDHRLPNFLANCYFNEKIQHSITQKNYLIDYLYEIITEFILTGSLKENEIIEDILLLPHSHKTLAPNFGYWVQKYLTKEHILKAIHKKEKKLNNYRTNCGNKQWLLLVVGGLGGCSYEMDESLEFKIESEFEHIYILEDFNNRLFQLK